MAYRVTFVLGADESPSVNAADASSLLECLTRINEVYLRSHPGTMGLHASGVHLVDVRESGSDWQDIPTCLKLGEGTLESLAAWQAAEQRIRYGVPARAFPQRKIGNRTVFQLDAFNGVVDRKDSEACLYAMLDCLVHIDEQYLVRHPNTPLLRKSGVYYQEEPPGLEDWMDIPSAMKALGIDCEDAACWDVAEQRIRFGNLGARPHVVPQLRSNGAYLYHIQSWVPGPTTGGRVLDASRDLGMR